jgi:ribosome-binding factor A
MKHRLERVKELIKRELSDIITRNLSFTTLVTVQHVDITPDLKKAHIYISAIGDEPARAAVMTKLEENRVMLQHEMSKRVIIKYTPQLHFHLDQSVERGVRIINILNEIDEKQDEQ